MFDWLGLGPIPWPIVRRSRFVRELKEQGEAYRQNVETAEWDAQAARRELRAAEEQFFLAIQNINGWNEDGVPVTIVTDDGGPPKWFEMKTERVHQMDVTRFYFDVSNVMLNRLGRIPEFSAGTILRLVSQRLCADAIVELHKRM